jgi:3-methylcrotonyl-CoA carboxylase alpha subunit
MLAKIIAWGHDRPAAMARLRLALERVRVDGIKTNARYLWEVLGAEPVIAGRVTTRLLETELQPAGDLPAQETEDAWLLAAAAMVLQLPGDAQGVADAAASPWHGATGFRLNLPAVIRVPLRLGEEARWLRISREPCGLRVHLDGLDHHVEIQRGEHGRLAGCLDGRPVEARFNLDHERLQVHRQCLHFDFLFDTGAVRHASAEHEGRLQAPMPGHVLDVRTRGGASVNAGDTLVVLEAMKMEHSLVAPWDARVQSVEVKAGDRVEEGADLILLEPVDA